MYSLKEHARTSFKKVRIVFIEKLKTLKIKCS